VEEMTCLAFKYIKFWWMACTATSSFRSSSSTPCRQ
jgi:hypothetical protein